jgi:hypothetical protein
VKLQKNKTKFLAIIGAFIGLPRANFYVYTSEGKLVYHELLPQGAKTIAVLPHESGNDAILIGGKETIWKFDAK